MLTILYTLANWSKFKKMGYKGWFSLIPGHNTFIEYEAITENGWNMFMWLIPIYGPFVFEYKTMRSKYELWGKKAPNYAYFLFVYRFMDSFINPIRFGLLESFSFKKGENANLEEDIVTFVLSKATINKEYSSVYCSECGAEIKNGAKYCHKCGTKIK